MGLRTWLFKTTGIQLKKFNSDQNKNLLGHSKTQGLISYVASRSILERALETVAAEKPLLYGFVGRDIEKNKEPKSIDAPHIDASLAAGGKPKTPTPYRVVCFYTDDSYYTELAARLKETLEQFNIQYNLVSIPAGQAWEINCAFKAEFIQKQWAESDQPIVWVDADATIENSPMLFDTLDCDFAIHKSNGWKFSSGTLYFGKTDLAKKLIDQWVVRAKADPTTWDQTHLHSAWCDISTVAPLRTVWLPRAYLSIFDAKNTEPAVIKHWQASRKVKETEVVSDYPEVIHTEAGILQRLNNDLWRTPEEAFLMLGGADHIIPDVGFDFPEKDYIKTTLRQAIADQYPVLEIECGVGHIASLFEPHEYLGVDTNPRAIHQARQKLPQHNIRIIDDGQEYPKAKSVLMCTVLQHVSDEKINHTLTNICKNNNTVIISEVMDKRWRLAGKLSVFYRDAETYILLMQAQGFTLKSFDKKTYTHNDKEGMKEDNRLTTLVFKR